MLEAVATLLASQPHDVVLRELRKQLQLLGAGMVDGRVVPRGEADVVAGKVVEVIATHVHATRDVQPCEAIALLDLVRNCGYAGLEVEREATEAACRRRYPVPRPAAWRELAELRALATTDPAHCTVAPPAEHVGFTSQLDVEVPGDLLAFYAAAAGFTLTCRHVAASAGSICRGEQLKVREGRLIIFDRVKRHPGFGMIEQPGLSIMQALGSWWFVLEDAEAAQRRPLDLPSMIRFALLRLDAPSHEALVTDLAWQRFFG